MRRRDLKLLVGGEWLSTADTLPVFNPNDGSEVARVPVVTRDHLLAAVEAAAKGFEIWRRTSPVDRARIMMRAAQILRANRDDIAHVITLELGKPLAQSLAEVDRSCDIIEWDAGEGQRLYGRVTQNDRNLRQIVVREPVGIVAGFSPWNFPMGSPARKISDSLAAGCSIILKAAEEAPTAAMLIAEAFLEAGLPDGVLNVVYGDPAMISDFLIRNPLVRMITFTGSVPVGKHLAGLAGQHMKPVVMELGGHAPVIVCDDAVPEKIASLAVEAKCRNSGQICVSPTRFFVHDKIFDTFLDCLATQAASVRSGDGMDADIKMGPVASERRVSALQDLISDALEKGARLVCGGQRIGTQGYHFPLTVLADVPENAAILKDEPFGPVMVVNRFTDLSEAISRANSVDYALAAYAFTDSMTNADLISDNLSCGYLAINHFAGATAHIPFGGVKDSGYGREGGMEGVIGYTTIKSISRAQRY